MSIWISFYVKLEHGVTLVDAPLLLDEGFGLEEVSLTTLLELAELKPNADNLVNLDLVRDSSVVRRHYIFLLEPSTEESRTNIDCDGDESSSLRLPIITT